MFFVKDHCGELHVTGPIEQRVGVDSSDKETNSARCVSNSSLCRVYSGYLRISCLGIFSNQITQLL